MKTSFNLVTLHLLELADRLLQSLSSPPWLLLLFTNINPSPSPVLSAHFSKLRHADSWGAEQCKEVE